MGTSEADGLLERTGHLQSLEDLLDDATASSSGRLVFVAGEAGAGKTSLLRRFCDLHLDSARVLWGACDGLLTPGPLGPLYEIAEATGGELEELVSSEATPHEVGGALARELRSSRPTLLVLEDLHWADEATLDVVRLLGRKVEGVRALLLVSYRDDGLDRSHPLRLVLGELATGHAVERLRVDPLSEAVVVELAEGHRIDGPTLYRKTNGNPFFVNEVLSSGIEEIPPTVRDAVLARVARLSPEAYRLLEAVAVIPKRATIPLIQALEPVASGRIEECLSSGIFVPTSNGVAFRHELARLTIEESLSPDRRAELNHRALEFLGSVDTGSQDLARLAHHAEAAGDTDAVLRFAPPAAARAASLGAHREAAAQYARALRFADGLEPGERGGLLEARSHECHLIADFDDAAACLEEALECYRRVGDRRREGLVLRQLGRTLYCMGGGRERADRCARQAVEVLEQLPPSPDLALAYCTMTSVHMNAEDAEQTFEWGARAVELAERFGETELRIISLNDLGTMELLTGKPEGREKLELSLQLAQEGGFEEDAGRAFIHLAWAATRLRRYDLADSYTEAGVEYCTARDLDLHLHFMYTYRARSELDRGSWDQAAESAARIIEDPRSSPDARAPALAVLGLVRARRGDPDQWSPLDDAAELSVGGDLQRLAPVAAARAEALWLDGRSAEVDHATASTLELALERGATWVVGELACWRTRAGLRDELTDGAAAEPYALAIAGDGVASAKWWRAIDCPYEAALALADSDDEAGLRESLDVLQQLEARGTAAVIARRLRERGAKGLPRGPRPNTREHAAGLTAREIDVLVLVTEGLRNRDIAERLFLSEKTVGHHVSAILRKLDVRTRGEASAEARRLGVTAEDR